MAHRGHVNARTVLSILDLLTIIFLVLFAFQQSYSLSPQVGGWVEIPIPAIDGFKISFADSLHGWIISSSGAILYTSDAGVTWQQRQCPVQIDDAELVTNQAGWVRPSSPPGSDTLLYKSTNTGLSWVALVLPGRLTTGQSVSFISDSVVYAASDSAWLPCLWATTDGGGSWTRRSCLTDLEGTNMGFFDVSVGYVGNARADLMIPIILKKTTDAGLSWTTIYEYHGAWGSFGSFRFVNGKLGCYFSNRAPEIGPPSAGISLTWNRGESWIGFGNYPPTYRAGMARDSTHCWLVRYFGTIRRTTNAGATWQEDTLLVPITDILYDLYGHQFALGTGRLFRYDSTLTDVPDPRFVPQEFALFQNYPNPFNPTTMITYTLSSKERDGVRSQHVTLRVFDLLGREVATLVNEVKAPGKHEVKFDATSLPSGVYFYKLQSVSGSITKRMTLMK
jgi:photosystem II stability/assembly factor-like uncharacterized protein